MNTMITVRKGPHDGFIARVTDFNGVPIEQFTDGNLVARTLEGEERGTAEAALGSLIMRYKNLVLVDIEVDDNISW